MYLIPMLLFPHNHIWAPAVMARIGENCNQQHLSSLTERGLPFHTLGQYCAQIHDIDAMTHSVHIVYFFVQWRSNAPPRSYQLVVRADHMSHRYPMYLVCTACAKKKKKRGPNSVSAAPRRIVKIIGSDASCPNVWPAFVIHRHSKIVPMKTASCTSKKKKSQHMAMPIRGWVMALGMRQNT